MRPLAIDLFCGAGGASMGLWRAGFEVIGVDIERQPRYPFPYVQGDALNPPFDLRRAALIWASPKCQAHVRGLKNSPNYGRHESQIVQTREMLMATGVPFVIENVPGAPMRPDLILDGWAFPELKVIRERWFEASFPLFSLRQKKPRGLLHKGYLSIAGTGVQKWCYERGYNFSADDARAAMGIDWMTRAELSQAIPPAYSEFIGRAALQAMGDF